MDNDLLTLPQVRERLNLSYNTLNRYIRDGKIAVVVLAKNKRFIRTADLESFIRDHTRVY